MNRQATMVASGLTDLVDWAESRLPALIDEVTATILAQMDLYHADEVVPREELRRSVEHNLRFMVAALRVPDNARDFAAPRETGRRRAHQGAPLPEVLRAFRIGFSALWELLAERARDSRETSLVDALLTAATFIWQLNDEYSIALTEEYRATTAEMLITQQHRRSALVEALFSGQPGPEATPWEIARLLDLPPDGDLLVVVAETSRMAEESLPRIERRLADHGITSAWRLTPALQAGVVSVREGQHEEVLSLLRNGVSARTGVSPTYQTLTETRRALHLARVALNTVLPGRAEVCSFSSSPLAGLVAHDPRERERISHEVLGPVLELPEEDRAGLLDTLQAWLDHGGSAERAAEHLYCHPNTVRYRLRRVHELTGRSVAEPYGVAELATAIQALRLGKSTPRTHVPSPRG